MSSSVETIATVSNECEEESSSSTVVGDEGQEDDASNSEIFQQQQQQKEVPKQIIRYSTSTLFALRSSKLSQQKPACKNMELSCMAHYKPPPKMLIANMMPKFALNQMPNRGEESISPLSFHSNSSSSSNLSYQKRYQEGGGGPNGGNDGGYSNSRYYYNKYKNHEDGMGGNNGGSSRIIYKTTGANGGANGSNGNSIRFLKKAYSSKYEEHDTPSNSLGLISNKNILDNSSRVITAADHRNLKKKLLLDDDKVDNDKAIMTNEKKSPADEANNNNNNNNSSKMGCERGKLMTEVNANDLMSRKDLKKLPDDITTHLDDIFNDLSLNQLLDDKITEERESSRFSKWFNRADEDVAGKNEKFPDSQNNNSNKVNNNNAKLFHETEKYFQPIDKMESNQSLFDILKGNQADPMTNIMQSPISQPKPQKSPGSSGQIHSVEELEAKLRHHKSEEEQKREINNDHERKVLQNFFQQQLMPNLMQQQQQQQQAPQMPHSQNQEEINAFKKLLSQMAADEQSKIPSPMMAQNGQQAPNMLQQLMNKNFQQDIMMQQQYQKTFPNMGTGIKSPGGNAPAKMINPMIPQQPPFGAVPEIVKRPEIQALVQELTSGEISQYNLWQRLTAPGLSPIEREIITCALNIFNANSNGNASMFSKQPPHNLFQPPPAQVASNPPNAASQRNFLTAPIPIPQQTSPVPPLDQHLLFQHQAAVAANKQLRLSPLPAGMPQRIPSPRELQYHTQSIMQNALIRKKLEEQRENYRKRQEQEKQDNAKKNQQDQSSGDITSDQLVTGNAAILIQDENKVSQPDSPTKKAPVVHSQRQHAPSPSIFTLTPTSVLRKMTAEKESDASKNEKKKLLSNMPQHQQAPMRNPQQQQQQQPPFMGNSMSQMERIKMAQNEGMQFGSANAWNAPPIQDMKPIGRPIVKSSSVPAPQQNNAPSGMMNNFEFQQQQKINMQQKMNILQMQMKKQQMDNPVLSQFMAQQQQRAVQAQSQFRQFPQQQQMNFPMMQQSGRPDKPEEQMENRNMMNNGGCLSPTSNQLAKWFSPELLADASAGKLLPSLNNVGGQMLSLEELEKCMQNS